LGRCEKGSGGLSRSERAGAATGMRETARASAAAEGQDGRAGGCGCRMRRRRPRRLVASRAGTALTRRRSPRPERFADFPHALSGLCRCRQTSCTRATRDSAVDVTGSGCASCRALCATHVRSSVHNDVNVETVCVTDSFGGVGWRASRTRHLSQAARGRAPRRRRCAAPRSGRGRSDAATVSCDDE